MKDYKGSAAIENALKAAIVKFGESIVFSTIVCVVGGIESLGLSCGGLVAEVGAAVISAVEAGALVVTESFLKDQFNRYLAAADADWFVWMSGWGAFWNSVAGVTDSQFNPSMTQSNIFGNHIQIGVQFTSAPAGGGPDFFDIGSGGTLSARGRRHPPRAPARARASRRTSGRRSTPSTSTTARSGSTPPGSTAFAPERASRSASAGAGAMTRCRAEAGRTGSTGEPATTRCSAARGRTPSSPAAATTTSTGAAATIASSATEEPTP